MPSFLERWEKVIKEFDPCGFVTPKEPIPMTSNPGELLPHEKLLKQIADIPIWQDTYADYVVQPADVKIAREYFNRRPLTTTAGEVDAALRGGPGFDYPCANPDMIECANYDCQEAKACRLNVRTPSPDQVVEGEAVKDVSAMMTAAGHPDQARFLEQTQRYGKLNLAQTFDLIDTLTADLDKAREALDVACAFQAKPFEYEGSYAEWLEDERSQVRATAAKALGDLRRARLSKEG